MDNQPCPHCARPMARGVQPITLTYKDLSTTFDMPGWYCAECGESVHTGSDMALSDRHLNALKAQAENVLPPAEIRRIRRKLKLTQAAAGSLVGGGPNAFHKYESGLVLPSQAVSNLLYVLEVKPDVLTVLRDRQSAWGGAAIPERRPKRAAPRPRRPRQTQPSPG